jgi:hypothetical protein
MNAPARHRAQAIGSHIFHIAITVGVFVSGTAIAVLVWRADTPPSCVYTIDRLPDPWPFVIGVVAFVIGHYIGVVLPDRPPKSTDASVKAGRAAMVLVFFGATLVWIFEAVGTAQIALASGAKLEPITYYTRCAIYFDADFTGGAFTRIAIFGIFLIAGHWFWSDALTRRTAKP